MVIANMWFFYNVNIQVHLNYVNRTYTDTLYSISKVVVNAVTGAVINQEKTAAWMKNWMNQVQITIPPNVVNHPAWAEVLESSKNYSLATQENSMTMWSNFLFSHTLNIDRRGEDLVVRMAHDCLQSSNHTMSFLNETLDVLPELKWHSENIAQKWDAWMNVANSSGGWDLLFRQDAILKGQLSWLTQNATTASVWLQLARVMYRNFLEQIKRDRKIKVRINLQNQVTSEIMT